MGRVAMGFHLDKLRYRRHRPDPKQRRTEGDRSKVEHVAIGFKFDSLI